MHHHSRMPFGLYGAEVPQTQPLSADKLVIVFPQPSPSSGSIYIAGL